ncbi:MAG TPA: AAA family ATPase [Puia sp.]|nr:AAA family ATPase [Puia sp.]
MFYRSILNELKKWSNSPGRKPLILRGARQVGKTTVVDTFGATFDHYIKLNLETSRDKKLFTTSNDIHKLVQAIFIARGIELTNSANTLLFIDEIQQVEGASNMLRYFYEQYPDLRVIAAGSLLETILHRKTNVPVGRVDYRVMRPVSFPEFLKALGYDLASEQLEHLPLNDFAHSTLLSLFHTYALIGGMPEIVANYAEKKDLTALSTIYTRLINAYLDDVEKYGKTDAHARVIRHCIRVSFTEAGRRIKLQHFGRSD